MPQEPTYSQIEAALKAFFPNSKSEDHTVAMRDMMKQALINAQSVDRNIFGDHHCGGSVGSVGFMTKTVEDRAKIMAWEHAYSATVPALRQRLDEVMAKAKELQELAEVTRNFINVYLKNKSL